MKNDTQFSEAVAAYSLAERNGSIYFMNQEVAKRYFEEIKKGDLCNSEIFQSLKAAKREYSLIHSKMTESQVETKKLMQKISQIDYQKKQAQDDQKVDLFFQLEEQAAQLWRELKPARDEAAIFSQQAETARATVQGLEQQLRQEYQERKEQLLEQMAPHLAALNDQMAQLKFLGHQLVSSGVASASGERFIPYLAKYPHLNS